MHLVVIHCPLGDFKHGWNFVVTLLAMGPEQVVSVGAKVLCVYDAEFVLHPVIL